MKKTFIALAIGTFVSGAVSAASYTLTFDKENSCNGPCSSGMRVLQGYGDIPGIVDVTYADLSQSDSLKWWESSYNDLFGVLWSGGETRRGNPVRGLKSSP